MGQARECFVEFSGCRFCGKTEEISEGRFMAYIAELYYQELFDL